MNKPQITFTILLFNKLMEGGLSGGPGFNFKNYRDASFMFEFCKLFYPNAPVVIQYNNGGIYGYTRDVRKHLAEEMVEYNRKCLYGIGPHPCWPMNSAIEAIQ